MGIEPYGGFYDPVGERLKEAGEDAQPKKGKGEPIPDGYLQMDVYQHFQRIAREAGFLPPWLELQKEIGALVQRCKTEEDVAAINELIRKHNKKCPPMMQKNLVSLENLEKAKKVWE